MPQISNHIDVNQITEDLLNSQFQRGFARDFTALLEAFVSNGSIPKSYQGYTDEKRVKENIDLYKQKGDEVTTRLLELEWRLYSNLYSEEAREFFRYWNFINGIFPKGYEDIFAKQSVPLVLNKLNVFDEKTQLNLLQHLIYFLNQPEDKTIRDSIWVKIAANKFASPYDRARAAQNTGNPDMIRDAVETLKDALQTEMSQDFPNQQTVENLCGWGRALASVLKQYLQKNNRAHVNYQDTPEMQYAKTIEDEFDIKKVLALNVDYIPKLNQSLEERAIESEKTAENAKAEVINLQQRMEQNNDIMQRQERQLTKNLQDEKEKNKKLLEQLSELQQQLADYERWAKTAKIKAATLKAGLFNGNSIKEFQDFLQRGPNAPER